MLTFLTSQHQKQTESHKMTFPLSKLDLSGKSVGWLSGLTSASGGNCRTGTNIPQCSSPHSFLLLLLSFTSSPVLSSLKACPHTPCSSLCSLSRFLARCSTVKNTHGDVGVGFSATRNNPNRRCFERLHLPKQPFRCEIKNIIFSLSTWTHVFRSH